MAGQGFEATSVAEVCFEALRRLIVGACHEINNPLTAVQGLTDLLLQEETDPLRRQDLQVVSREAARAAEVIRNLRAFARGPEEACLCDVRDLLRMVLAARQYEARIQGIQLEASLAQDLPPSWLSPSDLLLSGLLLVLQAEELARRGVSGPARVSLTARTNASGIEVCVTVPDPSLAIDDTAQLSFLEASKDVASRFGGSVVYEIDAEKRGRRLVLTVPASS